MVVVIVVGTGMIFTENVVITADVGICSVCGITFSTVIICGTSVDTLVVMAVVNVTGCTWQIGSPLL